MKTLILNYKFIFMTLMFLPLAICSSDNDDGTDDSDTNNETFETVSQDVTNQEFFIEGIYITGPGRDEIKPLPNAVAQIPLSSKAFFEIEAGFLASETVYFGVTGQRLLDEQVSGENEIANPLAAKPFDHGHIVFAIDGEDDEHAPNAKLESIESITYVSEVNDIFDQSNLKITQSKFKVIALVEGVLGYTTTGDPIETITFIDNEQAFIDNVDGNIVVKYLGLFDELLNSTFSNSQSINLNILERSRNISSTLDRTRFYVDN